MRALALLFLLSCGSSASIEDVCEVRCRVGACGVLVEADRAPCLARCTTENEARSGECREQHLAHAECDQEQMCSAPSVCWVECSESRADNYCSGTFPFRPALIEDACL